MKGPHDAHAPIIYPKCLKRPKQSGSQPVSSSLKVQHGIPMVIGILSICVRTNFFG